MCWRMKTRSRDERKNNQDLFSGAECSLPLCQTVNEISNFSTTHGNKRAPPPPVDPIP